MHWYQKGEILEDSWKVLLKEFCEAFGRFIGKSLQQKVIYQESSLSNYQQH